MRRDTQLADVGQGVWVGNFDACDRHLTRFPRVVHILHPDQHGWCRSCSDRRGQDLYVEYLEGSPLPADLLDWLEVFCRGEGELLVHSSAGLGRGPTLALLALAARGQSVYEAMGRVAQAMWEQYAIPHSPQYMCKALNDIFRHTEGR